MIPKETVAKILETAEIVDVVSDFISLKKRGANYLGLCPFHNEKGPSFTVSPAKGIYKCFGCGKSGAPVNFIMEHEGLTYPEALRFLAKKYSIKIEEVEQTADQIKEQDAKESMMLLSAYAQQQFTKNLWEDEEGKRIGLSYFKERGFSKQTIERFQLGYSLESRKAFSDKALADGYLMEYLVKTGLTIENEGRYFDRFSGRVIFPIHNISGRAIAFGGRILTNDKKLAKYLNSPESEIYHKSNVLYGLFQAKKTIVEKNNCYLVEGYTDVVSLHQAGIENVVASGGTSLTPDQLRLIKKYTRNLTIIYDGDNAGIKAALRGLNLALEEGLNVKLVLIPDGEDPDSYVNKTGTENFKKFVHENKKDFVLFQLEISLKDAANDPAKRSFAVNQVAETLSKINRAEDFIRRQDYIRQVAQILQVEEAGLHALVNKLVREKISKESGKAYFQQDLPENNPLAPETQSSELESFFSTDELNEQALIRSLLEFGINDWQPGQTVAEYLFTEVEENELDKMMNNQQLVNIYETYKKWYEEGISPTAKNFLYHENRELNLAVINIMDYNTEISPNWKRIYEGRIPTREELYKEEVTSTLTYLKLRKIKKLIAENQREFELKQMGTFDDQVIYLQTHQHLKDLEMQLTKALGTVIFK